MRRLDLHGLTLEVEDAVAGEPSSALLGSFPPAPAGSAPALRLALRPTPVPRALPASGRPILFHGALRAVAAGGALHVGDGASALRVAPGGRLVEGELHASSTADVAVFANGLLLLALSLALRHHGYFHLHAGAVIAPGRGTVLAAGDSGAGKSTVTLALVAAGCAYLGDDSVLVAAGAGGPRVLALPRAFHVAPRTARALPALAPHAGPAYGATGKRLLDAEAAFPGAARSSAGAPRLLLFPSVAPAAARTAVEPIAPADALGRLVEAGALAVVDAVAGTREQLTLLAEVASGAQALALRLGRDLLDDPVAWARELLHAW